MIRGEQFKLVIPGQDKTVELYDLDNDIGETKNIVSEKQDVADRLQERLDRWTKELIEPRFLGLIHLQNQPKSNGSKQKK